MEPLAKQLPGWIAEQSKAKKVKGAPEPLDPALVRAHQTTAHTRTHGTHGTHDTRHATPHAHKTAQVEIMFGNVKELYKMHKPFAEALQHAIKNWYPYRRMGVLFMDVVRRIPRS